MLVAEVTVVDTVVFSRGPGGGNPCPLVLGAEDLHTEEMQALAARFGHETAFLLPATAPGAAVRLRYFVPLHEMTMCVHATVAAATWLQASGTVSGPEFSVETPLGVRTVTLEHAGAGARVWIEQWPPETAPTHPGTVELVDVLGIDADDLRTDWPILTMSTSRPKTLVPLRDRAVLDLIHAPGEDAWRLCERYGSTGIYPFSSVAAGRSAVYAARQFPVRAGYPEDPATGVAAGALVAYLAAQGGRQERAGDWASVEIWQGDAMGRPSVLWSAIRQQASFRPTVRVGGVAEILGHRTERVRA